MPSGYRINPQTQEELGFVPLLAAAPAALGAAGKIGGGIIKGIGSIFGGKKKKKPAATATPTPTVATSKSDSSAGSADAHLSGLLSSVAAGKADKDVKAEALAALNSYQKANASAKQKNTELVKQLAQVVKPAVDKIQADVATQALKTQVTQEHNKIMQDRERWEANEAAHKAIMQKFDQLEAALLGSNAATKKVFKIYGINV